MTDELRRELDRLASEAPTPGEGRDQVLRAARRRSRVGMAVVGGLAAAGVLAGVLALSTVLDRRSPVPIGPPPTGTVVTPTPDGSPAPEPTGEIAFFRDGGSGGSARLVVAHADGSKPRMIGDLSISTSRLSMAPDGSHAAFDHGLGEGSGQLETIDVRTGVATPAFTLGQPSSPDWSPDGTTIVFTTDSGALFTIPSGGADAGTAVRDEGDGQVLEGSNASWSPQGDQLVAVTDRGKVFIVPADGSLNPRMLPSTGRAGWVDWGPDGIVVSAFLDGDWTLSMLDPDGEEPPHLLLDRPGDETAPAISPDGDFVAFVGSDTGHVDLFVLDLASGAVTQLTHDAAQEISPVWVPSS